MIGLIWWSRGESIELRSGSVQPSPAAHIRAAFNGFDSPIHLTNKKPPRRVVFYWWSRGESIELRSGSVQPSPAALIRAAFNGFDFPIHLTNKKTTPKGGFFIGGAEGNRTPVRKQLGKTFSGRSLLFTFPHPIGNKHSMGLSSFMMHGTLKALRTHGLHSNHTRARLVDLPGRMGA